MSSLSASHLGVRRAVRPGLRLLELAGDADQDVLAAVGGDELHADRQALGGPVQRAG